MTLMATPADRVPKALRLRLHRLKNAYSSARGPIEATTWDHTRTLLRRAGDPQEEEPMAWIEIVDELGASGRLRELYEGMIDPEYGRVDSILRIHSLHPEGLRTHYELYREVMKGTPTLRKVEREMIALVVSVLNECHY
jgi:hypothetical protein